MNERPPQRIGPAPPAVKALLWIGFGIVPVAILAIMLGLPWWIFWVSLFVAPALAGLSDRLNKQHKEHQRAAAMGAQHQRKELP